MKLQPQAEEWTDRFGRSNQLRARERFKGNTAVLDRGLQLEQEPAGRHTSKPEAWLAGEVEKALRPRLVLRSDAMSYQKYDDVAADYSASIVLLRKANEDMRRLVDALVEANTTYSSSAPENANIRQAFWEGYYGAMTKEVTSSLILPFEMLSAALEGQPVETAANQLRKRLERMVQRFAKNVAEVFAQLQSVELIGRADWPVPTACDSFYFEDTVIHENLGRQVFTSPAETVEHDYKRSVVRVREEVTTVSKDRHVVRHGLHFKVIGNTRISSIGDFPDVIPVNVQRLLQVVPDWLYGVTQIVGGDTRNDFVVAQDIYTEERVSVNTEPHEREVPLYCPLVTVGDYVLTGWGAREADVETARQNYGLLHILAVLLAAAAAISMGLASLADRPWSYIAPVSATLSLAVFLAARRERASAHGQQLGIGILLLSGVAWFLLTFGTMALALGVAVANWVAGLAGIIATCCGAVLLRRAVSGDS